MHSYNIGPVQIELGGVSLGLIFGGATLRYEETVENTRADITGDNPRGIYVTGDMVEVTGAITEATLAQIAKITGGVHSSGTASQTDLAARVGTNLAASAAEAVLKPIVGSSVSVTAAEWTYIPACVVIPKLEVVGQYNGQKAWAFQAIGIPVTAAMIASGGHLYNSGSPKYAVNDLVRFGLYAA